MIKLRIFLIFLLLAGTVGCAAPEGGSAVSRQYFWPLPPDRPRIEWVNTYASQLDLPKNFFGRLKVASIGEDTPIELRKPVDIKAENGVVAVADPGAPGVYLFDLVRNEVRLVPQERKKDAFTEPVSLAGDKEGNFYALDARDQKIYRFNAKGVVAREIDLGGLVKRGVGVVFDPVRKRLLVADAAGNKIVGVSPVGEKVLEFGGGGSGDGEFNIPIDIAVTTKGDVVVADAMNARIQVFDPNGIFLYKFGRRGDGPSDFQQIKGVATDSDDNIYVTDARSHKITIYSELGDYLLSVGGYYPAAASRKAPGGFVLPQGLDIEKDMVYVVDQMNKRFQVFRYLPSQEKGQLIRY